MEATSLQEAPLSGCWSLISATAHPLGFQHSLPPEALVAAQVNEIMRHLTHYLMQIPFVFGTSSARTSSAALISLGPGPWASSLAPSKPGLPVIPVELHPGRHQSSFLPPNSKAHSVQAFCIFKLRMTTYNSDPYCVGLEMNVCVPSNGGPVGSGHALQSLTPALMHSV